MTSAATRPFEDLTPRGRMQRLRTLALDALSGYELDVRRCSFVSTGFNTVFRIDTADGSRYALRVSPALRIHEDGCEMVEAAWVAALRRDAGLSVPQVIPARDGSVVVWMERTDVPGARSCVLFEWVSGRPLRERMSADCVREVGALTAVVHDHGGSYLDDRPAGALTADRVLYFRTEMRLDELRPAYGSVLAEAVERAQRSIDRLWREPPHRPHLLHGDIQPGNVMVARGVPTLIDFQDLIWGFEAQDALIALRGLEIGTEVSALTDAFRAGYETVRRWPAVDAEMDAALRAARHLNILNFGLNIRGPGFDEFVTRHTGPITAWMEPRADSG